MRLIYFSICNVFYRPLFTALYKQHSHAFPKTSYKICVAVIKSTS